MVSNSWLDLAFGTRGCFGTMKVGGSVNLKRRGMKAVGGNDPDVVSIGGYVSGELSMDCMFSGYTNR